MFLRETLDNYEALVRNKARYWERRNERERIHRALRISGLIDAAALVQALDDEAVIQQAGTAARSQS